jgi:hypothetical protein
VPGMGLIASSLSSVINAGWCARDGPVAGAGEECEVLHMVPVGFHMWTGSSSTMGLLGGRGWISGRSMGTGCGGFSPRRSKWRLSMAWSSFGGDSWVPLMAAVSARVAAMMRSVAVIGGTGIAWCLKQNVSVRRSLPVSSMRAQMQR